MKRALIPALFLALLLVVPALSQGEEPNDLESEIKKLKEIVLEQDARVMELEAFAASVKAEAATLVKNLQKADKGGFTYPAPNTDARKALLLGLQRFAHVTSGASGKPPDEVR